MITLVIPTLNFNKAESVAEMACATAMTKHTVKTVISYQAEPKGFTKAVNDGIKQADVRSDICLLNDDISWFQLGWLEILRRVLYSHKNYGLSAPTGHSGTAPMKDAPRGLVGQEVVRQAPFWCVLMKRRMLDELGLLDERMIHYCSDNYYCDRMRKMGWKCVWAKAAYLEHHKHGSGTRSKWRDHDRKVYFSLRGK